MSLDQPYRGLSEHLYLYHTLLPFIVKYTVQCYRYKCGVSIIQRKPSSSSSSNPVNSCGLNHHRESEVTSSEIYALLKKATLWPQQTSLSQALRLQSFPISRSGVWPRSDTIRYHVNVKAKFPAEIPRNPVPRLTNTPLKPFSSKAGRDRSRDKRNDT